MMRLWRSKKVRRAVLVGIVPAFLGFWLITAPAGMAVQRIAAGIGNGPFARLVIRAAEWYECPLEYVDKVPALKRMTDSLQDRWCELLSAPETTHNRGPSLEDEAILVNPEFAHFATCPTLPDWLQHNLNVLEESANEKGKMVAIYVPPDGREDSGKTPAANHPPLRAFRCSNVPGVKGACGTCVVKVAVMSECSLDGA